MDRNEAAREQAVAGAILCAVAAGASREEIDRAFAAGDGALAPVDVAGVLAALERQGLVRATGAPRGGAGYQMTGRGRRAAIAFARDAAGAAAGLEAERRRMERLRDDLLATFSHELRTPLTLIRTSIGLLLDSDPEEEMRLRLLRNIKQSSDRMHALVSDLLDLARLRGDRLELQVRSVDLGELIAGAVSLMRPLLDAKAQRVRLAVPSPAPRVPGDARRLERVVLNLLSNAHKFAPAGSEIAIAVADDAQEATVAVRDRGPGITAEAMPHLFDQFFTNRTSSSRHNIGAGLGLPIAKGLVEAHGGRIWVASEGGAGTTVSFALPKGWPEEEDDEAAGG
jgi:signal transduction histidine kinase